MMRKVLESERGRILEYVMAEPEINLFFIGDIENYGVDSDEVEIFVQEVDIYVPGVGKMWDSLTLRYFDNYIIYSRTDSFQLDPVIQFLKGRIVDSMNGKASIMRRIAPFFPKMRLEVQYLLKCSRVKENPVSVSEGELRLLTEEDAEKIVDLYLSVVETAPRYEKREKKIAERKSSLHKGGFGMGAFSGERLISVAEISAECARSGMIIGVATHPDFRGRGYAMKTVSALCEEAFGRGKEFLCLFYSNPDAGRLYKKIGFEEKGQYALML